MSQIQQVLCSEIQPGDNDRQHFDANALRDLATSIQQDGLAQPITVRPIGGHFQIVAGERRFRAVSQILQWTHIDAIVRELNNEAASAIMLAENTGRADLNPIEEALAYQKRIDQLGWSVEKVSQTAGVSPDLVTRRIKLLSLVEEVQHLLKFGHFPIGHAESMNCLDNNRQRIAVRVYLKSDSMSADKFRQMVNQLYAEQSQESLFDLESLWTDHVVDQKSLPRRGKQAVINAPTRSDLPIVQHDIRWNSAQIIERYIADLISSGHLREAGALGNLWTTLVRNNYMSVPEQSSLDSICISC